MRRVVLESPFAGATEAEQQANIDYARACVADCLQRGDSAIASHLLYTQPGVLRDDVPGERELGIAAGLAWLPVADATVVYTDRGVSPGMLRGIRAARQLCIPVEWRSVTGDVVEGPAVAV
jgi:hypothetical protein